MKIQHNLWAMNANRNIKINTGKSAKTTEKLSSGYRINRAADDAAGLSISEKMRRLIRGLTQASRNCQDGISMVQTAEGALHEVHDMLQRMNELAVQSANGTNAEADREALQQEFSQIQDEIDRVSQTTTFNAMRLFADEDSSTGTTNASGTNGTNNTNGTGGANGTNNSNTPSVTSLDETQQEAPVMRMMSLRSVAAVAETSTTVGDFTVTGDNLVSGTDYSYADGVLTILSNKAITIANTNPDTATTEGITIDSSVTAGNITLAGVNISTSASGRAGLRVNGTATVTLANGTTNTIHASNDHGITLGENASLTLEGEGSLDAKGGRNFCGINVDTGRTLIVNNGIIIATGGNQAAGIGGGSHGSAGTITINGGEVTANGANGGAGIGGGHQGGGGTITITGGYVVAKAGITGDGYGGAGIGGGYQGGGGTIVVSGGCVEAWGCKSANAIGHGARASGGSFSTGSNGSATLKLSNADNSEKISELIDTSNIVNWSGWINDVKYGNPPPQGTGNIDLSTLTDTFEITDTGYKIGSQEYKYTGEYTFTGTTTQDIIVSADANVTLGDNVTVKDITVALGKELTINGNKTINVNGTFTNNGTVVNNSLINSMDYITGNGTITGSGIVIENDMCSIDLSYQTDTLTITDTGYTIGSQQYSYTGDYTFKGATDKAINVNTSANITLDGVTSTSNLNISNNSTVTATLVGNNTIDKISVASGSELILDGTGTLNVTTKFDAKGSAIIKSDVTVVNNGSMGTSGSGTVDNYGHIINNKEIVTDITVNTNAGTFTNYGVIDSNGNSKIENYGNFINEDTGVINLNDSSKLNNSNNWCQLINDGKINVGENASFLNQYNSPSKPTINNGTIVNNGTTTITATNATNTTTNFVNNGKIENNNSLNATGISNNGNIVNNDGGTAEIGTVTNNDGGVISNAGTMTSTGTLTNKDGGTVNNTGEWSNSGTVNNESGGTINNSGTLGNTSSGTITNDGTIENTGALDNGGSVTNNGEINNSGTVSGDVTGIPPVTTVSSGSIDLSTLTDTLTITDTGYKIGNAEFIYNGPYIFSGTTTQEIVVENNADITLNNVTGTKFSVKNNSTADVKLNGTSTMDEVIIENGSTLNTTGAGTLKVLTKLTNNGTINNGSGSTIENDGTVENGGIFNNSGTLDNDGTISNTGTINNNTGGTIENDGTIDNDGTLKNDGTVNNNTGSTIDNTNGTINNSSGTINDNGTITGNNPTTGGGTGGGSGSGGTGGATAGTAKNSWWIQAGAEAGQGINIEIGAMNTKVLGIDKGTVNILTQESSGNAITAVSGAIEKLSEQRSRLGAYQNRLEHTIYNLDNIVENTTAAESQIRDADMAELMVEHSSNNIIMQAAQAMLAQANHQPDGVLQLLQ